MKRKNFAQFGLLVISITTAKLWAAAGLGTYDFTGTYWPAAVNSTTGISNVTKTKGTGITLTSTSRTASVAAEGYIDITFASAAAIYNRNISIDADTYDELTNGDFETSTTLSSDSDSLGGWQYCTSSVCRSTPTISTGSFGTGNILEFDDYVTSGANYIQQAFEIDPGEPYRISFDYDGTDLLPAYSADGTSSNDGGLEVRFKYLASSLSTTRSINFLDSSSTSGTPPYTTRAYEKIASLRSGSSSTQNHRYFTADDTTHTLYDGTTPVTFKRYNPTTSADTELAYGQLVFAFTSSTTMSSTSKVRLDNVKVEWERQLEAEIIDTAGTVIQRTTDRTFFVPSFTATGAVTLRIYLRSNRDGYGPTLRKVHTESNAAADQVAASVSTTSLISVSEPRLGVDMNIAPKSEFADTTTYPSIQTQCFDSLNSSAAVNCFELYSKYNLTHARLALPVSGLTYSLNSSRSDYDVSVNSTGEAKIRRIEEAYDAGLDPSILFYVHGDMSSIWNGSGSSCSLAVTKPTSGTYSSYSDENLSKYLIDLYVKTYANELDGSRSGGATSDPVVTDFEIFNEPNLMSPVCSNMLSDANSMAAANEAATTLRTERSSARILAPSLSSYDIEYFDQSFFTSTVDPSLTPATFDATNWHPYADTHRPEDISSAWTNTETTLSSAGWSGKDSSFTEWGFAANTYDPSCNSTYSRGYGVTEQANLLSRQLISMLGTTGTNNLIWGQFNNEWEGSEGDCWKSDSGNKTIFNRYGNSGILGTDSSSPGSGTTQYEATLAGNALLIIGKQLGYAEPTTDPSLTVTMTNGYQPSNENYYAKFFKVESGYALAMWFYRDYQMGDIDSEAGETTETYYQNYMYGASSAGRSTASTAYGVRDYGYESTRLHRVTVNFPTIPTWLGRVGKVGLDSSTGKTSALSYTTSGNSVTVNGVVLGERPVILLFSPSTSSTAYYDGLGPWIDVSSSAKNTWHMVNADTGSALPWAYRSGTWSYVSSRYSPLHSGKVYPKGIMDTYPTTTLKTYNECYGNSGVKFGVCIKN